MMVGHFDRSVRMMDDQLEYIENLWCVLAGDPALGEIPSAKNANSKATFHFMFFHVCNKGLTLFKPVNSFHLTKTIFLDMYGHGIFG